MTDTQKDRPSEALTGRRRLAGRLIAVLRDEVAANLRIEELLAHQEASVTSPSSDAFRDATVALEAELQRTPHRTQRRTKALRGLSDSFGVSSGAVTLTSLVERLEGDPATVPSAIALGAERDALRAAGEASRKRIRRVGALVRMHREVTRDLVQVVLGGAGGEDVQRGGTLIDAEV